MDERLRSVEQVLIGLGLSVVVPGLLLMLVLGAWSQISSLFWDATGATFIGIAMLLGGEAIFRWRMWRMEGIPEAAQEPGGGEDS